MKRLSVCAILTVLWMVSGFQSAAQSVSLQDSRRFHIAILNVLDEYERTASFSETKDRLSFLRLFADPASRCVYNDLIGTDDFQQSLTPEQYLGNVPDNGTVLIRTTVSDVRKKGEVTREDGLLHRQVTFTKNVMIIDASVYTEGEGGVLFDSSFNFGENRDFRLCMDLSYDPASGDCRIGWIRPEEVKEPSPLDNSRFSIVVRSSNKYDSHLVSRGKPLVFNEFNQAVAYFNDVDINNPDVYVEPFEYASGDRYNVLGMTFHPMYMRFKVYGDITAGNAYDVKSSFDGIRSASRNIQLGADLGFEVSLNSFWRMGLYAGAGFSLGSIGLSAKDVHYSLNYAVPVRNYRFDASEDLRLVDFYVPVYLENEFTLARKLVLDLDLGARVYLNHKTELGPYRVTGEVGNQTMDASISAFISPAEYTRSPSDIALYGNLELDYCLVKRNLFAYVSYGYEYGLHPSYDSGLRPYFMPGENVYPFYYSMTADQDYPYRSLIGSVSYQRKAGWASVGVKFKF